MLNQRFIKAAFSSKDHKWETPRVLIDDLAEVFTWDLDVCASQSNVCKRFFNQDSLSKEWRGLCWMNPPYGREIGLWIKKARLSFGATVVCLVPARTDTQWWQDNAPKARLIVFIKGRLRFEGAEHGAPFPSAFMVFGALSDKQKSKLCNYGLPIGPDTLANDISHGVALTAS